MVGSQAHVQCTQYGMYGGRIANGFEIPGPQGSRPLGPSVRLPIGIQRRTIFHRCSVLTCFPGGQVTEDAY